MRALRRKAFAPTAALLGLLGLTAGLRANDLTTGLVAYYPLDGNASDMSGNGRDGTSAPGQAPISGSDRHGGLQKAYFFDGVNDKVNLGTLNSEISGQDNLTVWAEVIRKTFYDGGVDEVISTRRLDHIAKAFAIFKDKSKSIDLCVARFDEDTKVSFLDLYGKIDAGINPLEEVSKEETEVKEEVIEDENDF